MTVISSVVTGTVTRAKKVHQTGFYGTPSADFEDYDDEEYADEYDYDYDEYDDDDDDDDYYDEYCDTYGERILEEDSLRRKKRFTISGN